MVVALRARRFAAFAAVLACTNVVAAGPAAAHEPPLWWEFTCGSASGDAVAYDHSFDVEKIPDAEVSGLRVRTTPISDRLDFPDGLTSIGYELYCIRVVVDIVHPDRSDLRVELRLPDAVGWRVVYENGKPGPDLHLSIDRAWSRPDWAKLRITDVDPVDEGALVYWRVEGHYRSGSFPPLPPVLA